MTTSVLTKKSLAADLNQAKALENLHNQMRTNSESNRISESSFEDAMIRQYRPLVNAIDTSLVSKIDSQIKAIDNQTKALLAIEGPKPKLSLVGESPGRMYNLPRDILEDYMTMPDSERDISNGMRKTSDGSYMFNNTAVNFDEDRKYVSIGDKHYKVTRGLMEVLTMKSPREGQYSPEDVDAYLEILNKYGKFDSLTSNSHRKKWLDKVGTLGFKTTDAMRKLEKSEKNAKKERQAKEVVNPEGKLKGVFSAALSSEIPRRRQDSYYEDPNEPSVVSDEDKLKAYMSGSTPFRKGSGLMPSNPLSLYKMLNLRLAAYKAGNTGLRNEIIEISDELLRQKAIKSIDYKKIVNIVENVKQKKK